MNIRRLIVGAFMGLTLLIISEIIRFTIEDSRTLADSLWSIWVIPFGAIMFSISRRDQNTIDK